jgi:hypothetical protein
MYVVIGMLGATPAVAGAAQIFQNESVQYRDTQGIPPGHLPPAGLCRVWYDGVPPGRQPRATDCRTASQVASRDRNARVIYGDSGGWGADPRAVPRGSRSPNVYSYPGTDRRDPYSYNNPASDFGYRDGYEKGLNDVRKHDRYDPGRHGWYKSADRGYDRQFGSKDRYKDRYREAFISGYSQGYRQSRGGRW